MLSLWNYCWDANLQENTLFLMAKFMKENGIRESFNLAKVSNNCKGLEFNLICFLKNSEGVLL